MSRRRTAAYTGLDLPEDHRRSLSRLYAELAEAIEAGDKLPCTGPKRHLWTSDTAADQTVAADRCWDCVAVFQCREYVQHHPERAGVFGGLRPHERN